MVPKLTFYYSSITCGKHDTQKNKCILSQKIWIEQKKRCGHFYDQGSQLTKAAVVFVGHTGLWQPGHFLTPSTITENTNYSLNIQVYYTQRRRAVRMGAFFVFWVKKSCVLRQSRREKGAMERERPRRFSYSIHISHGTIDLSEFLFFTRVHRNCISFMSTFIWERVLFLLITKWQFTVSHLTVVFLIPTFDIFYTNFLAQQKQPLVSGIVQILSKFLSKQFKIDPFSL